jgi:hypothetical protein
VKRDLPAHGTIGYLGPGGHRASNSEEGLDYLMIQYNLAPLIVDNSINHDLVIGNFLDAESSREITVEPFLVPLKNYNNGIVLYGRVQR